MNTQKIGQQGEALACDYLIKQGLRLVSKNYHCRYGEIDLIMQQDQTIVFIEVRLRKSTNIVDAATSINWSKQQKLQRSAENYLQQKKIHASIPARFDVIAISYSLNETPRIDWIQNAFDG